MADYIPGITGDSLAHARESGRRDDGIEGLLHAERKYITQRRLNHGLDNERPLAALALSGGGIRSAAFALGVMQKLAADSYLCLFDYLSTVSGGGYIGSSLTWLT